MKKVVVVLGILLVLLAAVAVAGCTSSTPAATNPTAAPTQGSSAPAADTHSLAGSWTCVDSKAHDTFKATEVVLNADGTGKVTYYKQIINGPTTNDVKWYWDEQLGRFHIESGTATTYLPTAYYDLSADGKTLKGSTATLTKA